MKDMNPRNWPKAQDNIMHACNDLFRLYGHFDLRRGEPTPKARKVIAALEKIADKYKLKRLHLFNVYFGQI